MKRKRFSLTICYFLLILLCIIFIIFFGCLFFNGAFNEERFFVALSSFLGCENIIKNKATELSLGATNKTEIVLSIGRWVSENITFVPGGNDNYYYKKCWTDCEILSKGGGPCGEIADLVKSLINSLEIEGLKAFSVYSEGHQWNEILIDDENIFMDSSHNLDGFEYWFNISKMDYENKEFKNISLSVVKKWDNIKLKEDVTESYTKTNKMIVTIKDISGRPISFAKIILKSHALMEKEPWNFPKPEYADHCFTNSSGSCIFEAGGKNETNVTLYEYGKPLEIEIILFVDSDIILISFFGIIIFVLIISTLFSGGWRRLTSGPRG